MSCVWLRNWCEQLRIYEFFNFVYCRYGGYFFSYICINKIKVKMNFLDLTLFIIFFNFLFVIFIFWFITFIGSFFFKKKENYNRNEFYECGFKAFSDINFNLNYGTFIVMVFVILYDVELSFLIPYLLNSYYTLFILKLNFFFFYLFVLITFIIDVYEEIIKWDI